ncbi:MAG TPA: cyclophane-forming radical SAM/SPASM peptide maturase GrrM/OscB [Acetobacteraceae bacterium]|nr:cyclophane-forming radical SAM/SPASM peptide maturase GrrM/OscB [Acetobacteraceae bacterium]
MAATPPVVPRDTAATPRVDVVVVQPTPFCNIDCRYCYLPSRNDRSVIEQSTVFNLFSKLFASGWAGPHVNVIWHAGEPLVMPIDFYREAFATIERLRPEHVCVVHSFQSNGMLITPAWCEFFIEWRVDVGVSIDGPKHLHDRKRVTRAGRGTFDKTLAGIRLLRQYEIPFHTISVLSHDSLDDPDEMYEFFVAEGIDHVCFNVEESEGQHVSDMMGAAGIRERFRAFLARFWQLARASDRVKFVREVDTMITAIFRSNDAPFRNQQVEPLAMMNVDCLGNVSTFSPELLGYKDARYNDFLIGNINTDSMEQMLGSAGLVAMQRDIDAGVAACRTGCEYFSVCGGGAPMNKLSENGSFSSTQTTFCSLIQMAAADLVLASARELQRNWDPAKATERNPGSAYGWPAPGQ